MRFGILGPLEVADDSGDKIALRGRKQRSVLAILLLHANDAVSRDHLVEELWPREPPASAAKSLQAHVSRLRRVLDEDGRIATTADGYLIRAAPGELDAADFERFVEEGTSALADGDPEIAARRLRDALSLWRGLALSDFRYESFAQSAISQLEESRREALETRVDAELGLGEGAALVAELEGLVREHPMRERLRGQLMLALYRAGRQADALATYRDLSRVLRDELGLQPSEPLRELELAILRHDPSLSPPAAIAPPSVPGDLPVPATAFLGRARELATITALIRGAGARLLTLTGAGGSGKTRLALQAAHTCTGAFQAGAWFVGFTDLTDPSLIASAICQTLGLAEQPSVTPRQQLAGYLRDHEQLLVLDNLEHLTAGAGILGELLADCPRVKMLVTSREPLHLAGELQYEVPVLEPEDAIELFVARAQAVAPNLIIERESVDAVCERLDRLPLAIELAAARTKVLSPTAILARLDRRLPVLATGPRDAPRRQLTLQATIDWSYELLTDKEKRLFARLSVFADGCTLQAAEAACDAELDTLAGLVDRSLLRTGAGRFWMLQTLREYALEKLARSREEASARRRHAQWFVELLQGYGLDKSADVDTGKLRVLLEEERENFRAALESAQQAGDIETVARLAAPLTRLWGHEGTLSEAERWIGVARERSADYPKALQALVLSAARELALVRGAHQEAVDLGEQALELYRELGDMGGVIRETSMRGGAVVHLGDLPRARVMMEDAVQLAREHQYTGWLPRTLGNLADLAMAEGELDRARALCEEALSLGPPATPNAIVTAYLQLDLADIANLERRYAPAAKLAQDALVRLYQSGHRDTAAGAALSLAWSLAELRQPERAAQLLGAALEFYRQTGTAMQWSETTCEQAARDALATQLDERGFHALLDQGRTMTVEQALRSGPRGERTLRVIAASRAGAGST
jgi:predicted ATPase/DNA-binding SARP family transcriptional activator